MAFTSYIFNQTLKIFEFFVWFRWEYQSANLGYYTILSLYLYNTNDAFIREPCRKPTEQNKNKK